MYSHDCQLVEHLGKIIARPRFGNFVADDMIDMNSLGAQSVAPGAGMGCGGKVRRGQAPTRSDLVVLGKHILNSHLPVGKRQQQLPKSSFFVAARRERLESNSKIYEIFCKDVIEFVEAWACWWR